MNAERAESADLRIVELRARNRRLGLILASIALVFFLGAIVKYALPR